MSRDSAQEALERLHGPVAGMTDEEYDALLWPVGLDVAERDDIGSEWRERWEEEGRRDTSRRLLRIATMRRNRDGLVAALGQAEYDAELANCHWGVYPMLGKLHPRVYVAEKRGDTE